MRVVMCFVLAAALAACDAGGTAATDKGKAAASQGQGPKVDRSHAGTPAPSVGFEMRDGKTAKVADFKGKPVLVNLWATWCAPCIAELPALDEMAEKKAKTLTVLPVSQDLGGWRSVDKFWTVGKFEALEPRLDKAGNYAVAVGAAGLPVSILYDAQGKEVWRIAGPAEWNSDAVARLVG